MSPRSLWAAMVATLLNAAAPFAPFRRKEITSAGMHQELVNKQQTVIADVITGWCLLQLLLQLACICLRWVLLRGGRSGMALMVHLLPIATALAVLVLTKLRLLPERFWIHLMFLACAVVCGSFGWLAHESAEEYKVTLFTYFSQNADQLTEALTHYPVAAQQLDQLVNPFVGEVMITVYAFFSLISIDAFPMSLLHRWTLILQIVPLSVTCITASLSPTMVFREMGIALSTCTILTIYFFLSSLRKMRTAFREFSLDYKLQCTLAKEADALRLAKESEAAHREASQKADSILNHILKNIMADTAGCIELFRDGQDGEYLERAQECLGRGVNWCKKRQAMLRLTMKQYEPVRVPVSLQQFATELIRRRPIAAHLIERWVTLDPMLCDIVLDNAINNAFRHGHPNDPKVALSVTLAPCAGLDVQELTFTITNLANPSRPVITQKFVSDILAGHVVPQGGNTLSDHIGLEHTFLSAEAHGMTVSLEQHDDVVTFRATLEVALAMDDVHTMNVVARDVDLPAGLKVVCIDDSDIARRLLKYGISKFAKAEVRTFGESAADVDEFVDAALNGAHIAILDQNLEYANATLLGTDLVQRIIEGGYTGLICLRSANATDEDRRFYRQYGVNCVIGKEVLTQDMVKQLKMAYLSHYHLHGQLESFKSADIEQPKLIGDQFSAIKSKAVFSKTPLLDMDESDILVDEPFSPVIPGYIPDLLQRSTSRGTFPCLS